MVSSFAIAVADICEPEDRPRLVDQIIADSQPSISEPGLPEKRFGGGRPYRPATAPQKSPRGPPVADDFEERLGKQLHFSIRELAEYAGKSQATVFRYLRLGQLPCIRVGGHRRFTRAVVLDFLRNGMRSSDVEP
jgi:excisionase family DNA binding protein